MAGGFNSIQIAGRLGKDPEIEYFEKTDRMKCTFSVAVDRYQGKDDQGKPKKSTDWFSCEAWGAKADFIGSHFRKGAGIIVTGDMQHHKWKTNEKTPQEQDHEMWRLNVRDAYFVPGGGDGEGRKPEPPADKAKTGGGGTKMNAAEFARLKAEKEKAAAQKTQESNIDNLMAADEIPF